MNFLTWMAWIVHYIRFVFVIILNYIFQTWHFFIKKFQCNVQVFRTLVVGNFAKNEMNKENIYTYIRKWLRRRIYPRRLQMYYLYLDNCIVIVNFQVLDIVIVFIKLHCNDLNSRFPAGSPRITGGLCPVVYHTNIYCISYFTFKVLKETRGNDEENEIEWWSPEVDNTQKFVRVSSRIGNHLPASTIIVYANDLQCIYHEHQNDTGCVELQCV